MFQIILTLIVGAFIGWVTNYLAVLMLFRPYRAYNFLGIKFIGVFPKRQQALATKIGALVARELFSSEDIKQLLQRSLQKGDLLNLLDAHIERVLLEKVPLVAPMLAFALNTDLVARFKNLFMSDIEDVLAGIVNDFGDKIDQQFNVEQLVEAKIAAFSAEKLEGLLLEVMRREFRFIEVIGAVLGMLIAAVQVLLLSTTLQLF